MGDARSEYLKALEHRKYLHFSDDFFVAELYQKIGNSFLDDRNASPEELEEALEYLIQSYVIYEKVFDSNHPEVKKVEEKCVELCNHLSYSVTALEKRLSVQRNFLEVRYDERLEKQEEELIEYFGL